MGRSRSSAKEQHRRSPDGMETGWRWQTHFCSAHEDSPSETRRGGRVWSEVRGNITNLESPAYVLGCSARESNFWQPGKSPISLDSCSQLLTFLQACFPNRCLIFTEPCLPARLLCLAPPLEPSSQESSRRGRSTPRLQGRAGSSQPAPPGPCAQSSHLHKPEPRGEAGRQAESPR